jgi:hypothetical protein
MNDDAKTIGLAEFIRLFTLPGEPEEPVTLEGKAWDAERNMEVPSGEMLTWTPKHPPRPRRQIVLGINPPPIEEEVVVRTAWNQHQKRAVFVTHHSREGLEPEFVVDERGVRSLLPGVAEMAALHLSEEEKLGILEEIEAVNLTWPVSLNEVRAWAEWMDLEVASTMGEGTHAHMAVPPSGSKRGRRPRYSQHIPEVEKTIADHEKAGIPITQIDAIRIVVDRLVPESDCADSLEKRQSVRQERESFTEGIQHAMKPSRKPRSV